MQANPAAHFHRVHRMHRCDAPFPQTRMLKSAATFDVNVRKTMARADCIFQAERFESFPPEELWQLKF